MLIFISMIYFCIVNLIKVILCVRDMDKILNSYKIMLIIEFLYFYIWC